MKLQETLKALRVAHGYAQEQLAEKLDISRQAIAKWESGAALPELDRLIQLAALYQTTLDALVCGQQPCAPQQPPTAPPPDTAALIAFLLRAGKRTYAGGGRESGTPSRPGAHDLHYEEGDYRYIDSYLGGARFVGEEALYRKGVCKYEDCVSKAQMAEEFAQQAKAFNLEEGPGQRPGAGG